MADLFSGLLCCEVIEDEGIHFNHGRLCGALTLAAVAGVIGGLVW